MHLFNNYITFHTETKKAIKLNYCLLKCQRHAEYNKLKRERKTGPPSSNFPAA